MASIFDLLRPSGFNYAHTPPFPPRYRAGPFGRNGTQQFPRLTDQDIWEQLYPAINKQFWNRAYTEAPTPQQGVLNLIMNLKDVTTKATNILNQARTSIGYPPKEVVRALRHHIKKGLRKGDDPAYRTLIIIFQLAEIYLEVNPPATPRPPPPSFSEVVASDQRRAQAILDRLDELERELAKMREHAHRNV
jgi:hypothetical protein